MEKWVSVTEFAELDYGEATKSTENMTRRRCARGDLPAVKLNGTWRIDWNLYQCARDKLIAEGLPPMWRKAREEAYA